MINKIERQKNHINSLRKLGIRLIPQGRNPVVEVHCVGGCGTVQRVKVRNIKTGEVFVCGSRATRDDCMARIPHAAMGKVVVRHPQACGAMTGLTWEDKGVGAAVGASIQDFFNSLRLFFKGAKLK
ncbi:MAG: hypothetical protein ACRC8D_05945 [Aeromonas sp.]